jgi:RepB DNA-primase from phage plasmid
VAVFLKDYATNRVTQRVGPLAWARSRRVLNWLLAMNGRGFNVYVGVNAISEARRTRTRDAIAAVRHIFADADHDGPAVLEKIRSRSDLPAPSYILHSSPNRVHVFWRVVGFDVTRVERLQKLLASQLGTDPAATPVTQMTRLPGFLNWKYAEPHLVTVEYLDTARVFRPEEFPSAPLVAPPVLNPRRSFGPTADRRERSRMYLAKVPPAVAGQHGDVHTFRTCCRVVRGFGLDDDDALDVLVDWNARCQPPWTEAELRDKIRRARTYGREPIGGML